MCERKIHLWGVIIGVIVIVGLFGTWLWRGFDEELWINPKTGRREIRYHGKTIISPFFVSMVRDGRVESIMWFISFGTSLAGVILISASVLCAFRFNREWVNFIIFFISFLACLLFFYSLGSGLWIGILTQLGWGFKATLIGVSGMFFLSLVELLRER